MKIRATMADLSPYKDTKFLNEILSFIMLYTGHYWGFCIALLCPVFANYVTYIDISSYRDTLGIDTVSIHI